MIVLRRAELILAELPLVRPFRTSFGEQTVREAVLLRCEADVDGTAATGWGECVAMAEPLYSSEYAMSAWAAIRDFLVPMVARGVRDAAGIAGAMAPVRGHRMAKAAVEMALTDAWLCARGTSLSAHLGGVRDRVECGVSVGIAPTPAAMLEEIAGYVADGYRRIKLKISPGKDVTVIAAVRDEYPAIPITADANAAYTLEDLDTLRHVDEFGLAMIEQPFAPDRLIDHTILAQAIKTPVCLDETITSAAVAADAIALGACSIINVKQGRLGGLGESRAVHDLAVSSDVPVWCGGMLETGLGRAVNLALASMPGFTMPGDTSASNRYFAEDLTRPFTMAPDGTMHVPTGPGIGVEPLPDALSRVTQMREEVVL